ncbi:MAG: hypothetical protein COT85_06880 [Chlamydiae bacterium CG10_big_fil_rev_8_21_14_0_10_42_34]|nr:MAG: hypothetical protein COT85_06880 [Chlamydiae bacterium CG10_big_fil_rev_8_21_14_0_10_42_34]
MSIIGLPDGCLTKILTFSANPQAAIACKDFQEQMPFVWKEVVEAYISDPSVRRFIPISPEETCSKKVQETYKNIKNLAKTSILPQPSDLAVKGAAQKLNSFIIFFNKVQEQIPEEHRPRFKEEDHLQRNSHIRAWMQEHPELLDKISELRFAKELAFDSVPDEITMLKNLQILDLSNTDIEFIPDGFEFPSLLEFHLKNTRVRTLPEDFNPPRLVALFLDDSPIENLPEGFHPAELKMCSLNGTKIQSLGLSVPQLRQLNLNNTPFTHFPEDFNAPELRILNLSDTPSFRTFPENFNPLKLWNLNLSNSGFVELPSHCTLPDLSVADFSYTRFASFPEHVRLQKIRTLLLAKSNIQNLPLNLPCVEALDIRFTPIQIKPTDLKAPRLAQFGFKDRVFQVRPSNA